MTTKLYVPGTSEQDMSKVIMSQQLVAGQTATNTDNITTNTTNITALQTPNYGLVNTTGSLGVSLSKIIASLGADVVLNNVSNYFDGPSVAQGTTGTWFASGYVTVYDSTGASSMSAKLWDGTTVIASGFVTTGGAFFTSQIALSGFITSPAANIKISVNDSSHTTGKIAFNASGNSKDSTLSAVRIA